jgi:hypothetical protein
MTCNLCCQRHPCGSNLPGHPERPRYMDRGPQRRPEVVSQRLAHGRRFQLQNPPCLSTRLPCCVKSWSLPPAGLGVRRSCHIVDCTSPKVVSLHLTTFAIYLFNSRRPSNSASPCPPSWLSASPAPPHPYSCPDYIDPAARHRSFAP